MEAYEALRSTAFKSVNETLFNQSEALQNLDKQYRTCQFSQLQLLNSIDVLYSTVAPGSHGKIVVSGIGKSYKIATKMVATLNSLSIHSQILHPAEALHGDLGVIKDDDCIVLLTASGNTPELVQLLPHFPPHVPIVLLTCSRQSQLSQHPQVRSLMYAKLPPHLKEDSIHGIPAPTVSTTLSLALADAVIISLSEMINADLTTRKALFLKKHPGGSIGSDLRSVLNNNEKSIASTSKDDSKSSFSSQVSYSSLLSLNNIRQFYNSMSQPSHSQSSSQCSQSMSRSITSSEVDDDEYQTVGKVPSQALPSDLSHEDTLNNFNSNIPNVASKDTISTQDVDTKDGFVGGSKDLTPEELASVPTDLILRSTLSDFLIFDKHQLFESIVLYDYMIFDTDSTHSLAIKSTKLREVLRSRAEREINSQALIDTLRHFSTVRVE